MDSVGRRLKEERQLKGWSQRDLARETGVNADTISGIETGQHEPRPSTLRKLAEGLNLEVADFFREPAHPLAEAPAEEVGHLSIIDVAWDAARRQIALEKQAMFGGRETAVVPGLIDQRYANEAMRRLREEHALNGNDAEALVSFALSHARLEVETAQLREELANTEQEAARQQ